MKMLKTVSKAITAQRSPRQLVLMGAVIGAVFFLAVYGTASLNVTDDAWILAGHVEADITCDYAGWIHYRNAPWSWPPGVNKNIGFPYGNSIALSGPIAPLGLLCKLLSPVLPQTFQFYGWWALLCYMLQGAAAAALASLYTRNTFAAGCISLLFTASPILGERAFRHCSLMIHFVVLLAYYLYIRANRGNDKGQWWKYTLLATVALTIFPYFYPIVLGIMTASLLERLRRPKGIRQFAYHWLGCLTVPVAAAWLLGMFYSKTGAARSGFGFFSMNMTQPFNPGSYGGGNASRPGLAHEIGEIVWSRLLPVRPIVMGQYDGFNYLGLGILLALPLLAAAAVLRYRKQFLRAAYAFLRRHWALALVAVGFTLYALSDYVFWDDFQVLHIPLPGFTSIITGLFRASNRIFYGAYYLIFLAVIAAICRLARKKPAVLCAALALLTAVQLWDVSAGFAWKHAYFKQEYTGENRFDTEVLQYVGDTCDRLIFLDYCNYNLHELSVAVGKQGLITNLNSSPIDNIYGSEEYMQQQMDRLRRGDPEPGTAYIIIREALYEEFTASTDGVLVPVSDANWNYLVPMANGKELPESGPLVRDK